MLLLTRDEDDDRYEIFIIFDCISHHRSEILGMVSNGDLSFDMGLQPFLAALETEGWLPPGTCVSIGSKYEFSCPESSSISDGLMGMIKNAINAGYPFINIKGVNTP